MKKKRAGKIVLIILGSILLLLLLLALGIYIYANMMLNRLDRTEITGDINLLEEEIYEGPTVNVEDSVEHIQEAHQQYEEIQKIDIAQQKGITNILLIGSDRRNMRENGRSDSIMLVSLNFNTGKTHITSLMRAMYVCIPRSDGNIWGMLNAAYSWGGPNLLVDTVELNFRIRIDHYVVVDFAAFEKAVNMVGGVELNLSSQEAFSVQMETKTPTPEGISTLDGAQALSYARVRYFDNDFKRTSRQRAVIMALLQKVPDTDINNLISMANEILPLVNTNLTNSEIINYIIKSIPLVGNRSERMLPIENESGTTYTGIIFVGGREMYRVDFETNIAALHEFIQS